MPPARHLDAYVVSYGISPNRAVRADTGIRAAFIAMPTGVIASALPTPADYSRWLMDENPRDLLKPFPAEVMTMWPINRKVGSPKNDTPDILDREEPIRTDLFESGGDAGT